MRMTLLKLAMAGWLVVSMASGVRGAVAQHPSFFSQQQRFRQAAEDALKAEGARQKAGFCAGEVVHQAIDMCFAAEMKKTDRNYTAFVRALGALIRLPNPDREPAAPPVRIPFDDGEAAWQTYREQTCRTAESFYKGGTMANSVYLSCYLSVTGGHMSELRQVHSGLWD